MSLLPPENILNILVLTFLEASVNLDNGMAIPTLLIVIVIFTLVVCLGGCHFFEKNKMY